MEKVLNQNTKHMQQVSEKLGVLDSDIHALEMRSSSQSNKIKDLIQTKMSLVMQAFADRADAVAEKTARRCAAAENDIAELLRAASLYRADRRFSDLKRSLSRRICDLDAAITGLGADLRNRIDAATDQTSSAIARAQKRTEGRACGDSHVTRVRAPVDPDPRRIIASRPAAVARPPLPQPQSRPGAHVWRESDLLSRLKPGVILNHVRTHFEERERSASATTSLSQYLFGICHPAEFVTGPDDRLRNEGPRVIHPASRFNIGAPAHASPVTPVRSNLCLGFLVLARYVWPGLSARSVGTMTAAVKVARRARGES